MSDLAHVLAEGFPSLVVCVTELYLGKTRHTLDATEEEIDSRDVSFLLSGLIRMATVDGDYWISQ